MWDSPKGAGTAGPTRSPDCLVTPLLRSEHLLVCGSFAPGQVSVTELESRGLEPCIRLRFSLKCLWDKGQAV